MKRVLQILAATLLTSVASLSFGADQTKSGAKKSKVVEVEVTKKGFEPSSIDVAPGTPLSLKITRKTDATCAKTVVVAGIDVKKELPLNQPVLLELGTLKQGEVRFGCGMGMMLGGKIIVK